MQILFSFNESGEPLHRTIVADTDLEQAMLEEIAERMMLAVLNEPRQCGCGAKCQQSSLVMQ